MLSDNDIKKAITDKLLLVEPFSEESLNPAALVLHLGFNFLKPAHIGTIDPLKEISEEHYEKITLKEGETYTLKPGEFILGETFEKIGISKSLGMLTEGTSTMARLGVSVVQTSMIVDTGVGFGGDNLFNPRRITLEMKNNGPNGIVLHAGMRISKAIFFRLESEASYGYDEKGKYRGQEGVGAPKPTTKHSE